MQSRRDLEKGRARTNESQDLVAFIPLDKQTAKKQGTKGWQMPAPPLFQALKAKTDGRVAISDVNEALTSNATNAGIRASDVYIDYFLI